MRKADALIQLKIPAFTAPYEICAYDIGTLRDRRRRGKIEPECSESSTT